ncbi:MAG TPA: molybdate ABC transporter permease subunit [Acidobacteriota bacterium]|nr:molybdate ABC transporter permease subunit [Acidobacteriota bacterium]
MDEGAWMALRLSLQVASLATLLVLLPGVPLAYFLARFEFRGKGLVSALVGLPLVLPPTAVGYLLLEAFSVHGILGKESLGFDPGILLTWRGAVLAAAVMSLPLVVRTARVTFEGVDPRLEMMARTLGHGRLATFASFTLPLSFKGLLAAAILGFTRAIGEFGATVTIAGNIPGRTQTLASAIFSAQQVGADREAYFLLAVSLAVGFTSILLSEHLSRKGLARASTSPSGAS